MITSHLSYMATWAGIILCLSQSALFSGLNLAYFSITRLRLEVEASTGNQMAETVLRKRTHHNYLLATILWGNVGINVLLTLLSDSVMSGIGAFMFSTVVITIVGEIIPQAYFSRHAMVVGHYLSPVISMYEIVLYPIVKPVAVILDAAVGEEGIRYFREPDFKQIIREHVEAGKSEIGQFEGIGALNFLTMDDLQIGNEGVPLDPDSIIELEEPHQKLQFPNYQRSPDDPFLQRIQSCGKKWIVFTDPSDDPVYILNTNRFLRDVFLEDQASQIRDYCHNPVVIRDAERSIGSVMKTLVDKSDGEVTIHQDLLLLWRPEPRIMTGSDLLRRLLRGTKIFGL